MPVGPNWKILQTLELQSVRADAIPDANAQMAGPLDQHEMQRARDEFRGFLIDVGYQIEARDRLAEIGHRFRTVRDISNVAIRQHENTRVCRQRSSNHRESSVRCSAEAVLAVLEPIQRDRRQPARFAGQRRQALGAPVGDPSVLVLRLFGRGNVHGNRRGYQYDGRSAHESIERIRTHSQHCTDRCSFAGTWPSKAIHPSFAVIATRSIDLSFSRWVKLLIFTSTHVDL